MSQGIKLTEWLLFFSNIQVVTTCGVKLGIFIVSSFIPFFYFRDSQMTS